jgi:PKD repeat protein
LVGGFYTQTALDSVSGKSDTFEIEVLSIDVITITDTPDGNPLGTIIMGVGGKVSAYVSAYNSTGSIYLGLLEVDWSGAGGNWSPLTGNYSEFTAGAGDGLFVQTAFFSVLGLSDTFEVNILTAVVDYIQIRSEPFGAGEIVTDIIFDVGQSTTLWAAAYNHTYGFLGDREADWTEDTFGNIITVTTPGYSTLVEASDFYGGGATVTANVGGIQNTTTVTVNPPIVNFILIRDSPSGGGKDLCDIVNYPSFPVGHTATFYGAQYNYTAGYLGIVPGTSSWDSGDYDLVDLSPFGSTSTITCNDTTGGTIIITLDDGLGHDCATVITIIQPTVDYVVIRDSPDGMGLPVLSPFYDVGEEATFYAGGYNDTAGYLYDVSVTWECSDEGVGNITGLGVSVSFEAIGLGTCLVSAEYSEIEDVTGTITVVDITSPIAIIGPMDTMYEDETYTFNASSSSDNAGISDYHWSFGDGQTYNGPEPDADHIFTEPGTYKVTLTVTDLGGNTAVDEITVVILDVTSPVAICNLDTAQEKAPCNLDGGDSYDNVDIILYRWEFGDGRFYESQYANVTHIYERTGNYTVNLTVWDAAGHQDTTSSYVLVEDKTPPSTPKGLVADKVEEGEALTIRWNAVLDEDLDHYELYCSQEHGAFTKITDIDAGTTSYKHEGLQNGKSYRYYVVAVDTSDNPSSDSAIVEGIPDVDTDEDGIYDMEDYDDDDDGLSDIQEGEKGSDPLNPDSDGDSHLDGEDAFPTEAKEWKDTDRDGYGDSEDAFPRDADEWKDADGDGIGDNVDFAPIHDLLFYLIIAVIVIVSIIVVMLMMKRMERKKAEASLAEEQSEAPSQPESNQTPPPESKQ